MNKLVKQFIVLLPAGLLILLLSTKAYSQFNSNAWIEAFESCEASFPQMKVAYPEIYRSGYSRCMSSKSAADTTHCIEVAVASVCEHIAEAVTISYASPLPAPEPSVADYCKNLPTRRESFYINHEFQNYAMQVQNCRNMGIVAPYY